MLSIFSDTLRQLDKNTEVYMIKELEEKIKVEKNKAVLLNSWLILKRTELILPDLRLILCKAWIIPCKAWIVSLQSKNSSLQSENPKQQLHIISIIITVYHSNNTSVIFSQFSVFCKYSTEMFPAIWQVIKYYPR